MGFPRMSTLHSMPGYRQILYLHYLRLYIVSIYMHLASMKGIVLALVKPASGFAAPAQLYQIGQALMPATSPMA